MKTTLQEAAKILSSLEIWFVTGVVAMSMAMPSLLPWAVLVVLLFWPVRWIAHGRPPMSRYSLLRLRYFNLDLQCVTRLVAAHGRSKINNSASFIP